jgi:hypothetical protein
MLKVYCNIAGGTIVIGLSLIGLTSKGVPCVLPLLLKFKSVAPNTNALNT